MEKASLNGQYNESYEYDSSIGALKKVINRDFFSMLYLYDENGIYTGVEFYSPTNTLLRKVSYKENGAGDYVMVEQPGNKIIFLKYSINKKLVYAQPIGFPPIHTMVMDDLKIIMQDDQVRISEKVFCLVYYNMDVYQIYL